MSLTSFSNIYMQNEVNTFYTNNRDVVVNTTIELAETGYTRSEVDFNYYLLLTREIKRG